MHQGLARTAARSAAAVLVAVTLSACGQESAPGSTAEAAAAEAAASAAATSPSAIQSTEPTVQPEGEHGVTFVIDDWDRHDDDPVVLAWKKAIEAFYGSVNAREPNQDFLRRTAKAQRRLWLGNINYARAHDLVGAAELRGRVLRVSIKGDQAVLVGCDLRQTTNFRPRGKSYTDKQRGWFRMRNTFELEGDLWVMTDSSDKGRCPKGA